MCFYLSVRICKDDRLDRQTGEISQQGQLVYPRSLCVVMIILLVFSRLNVLFALGEGDQLARAVSLRSACGPLSYHIRKQSRISLPIQGSDIVGKALFEKTSAKNARRLGRNATTPFSPDPARLCFVFTS